MTSFRSAAVLLAAIGTLSGCAPAVTDQVTVVPAANQTVRDYTKAEDVAAALAANDVAAIHGRFTPEAAGAISAEQLTAVWQQVVSQMGALKSIKRETPPDVKAEQVALLNFEKGALHLLLAVTDGDRIAGLRLVPVASTAATPSVEPLAADDTITEQPMQFSAVGGPPLVGTLTLPKSVRNPPAVVLVHGSGPQDRYETISANRPFLDIARGLARQGIAVLSYDKRTFAHAKDIDTSTLTLDQETTDDALAAIQWLRSSGSVDANRLFVLGHSQGGLVAPRMLSRDTRIKGAVLLAGPATRLLDLLPHQNRTLLGDQIDTPQGKAHMDMINGFIRTVRDPKANGNDKLIGLPLNYWRSVDAVDPLADARQAKQPLLILQGAKDFQVIEQDWAPWKSFAAKQPKRVTFKLYPTLNHLAIPTEGKPGVEDYVSPRPVDPGLIKDVAAWIRKH